MSTKDAKKEKKDNINNSNKIANYLFYAFFSVLLISIGIYFVIEKTKEEYDEKTNPLEFEKVNKQKWNPNYPFYDQLIENNDPHVLENTIATKWRINSMSTEEIFGFFTDDSSTIISANNDFHDNLYEYNSVEGKEKKSIRDISSKQKVVEIKKSHLFQMFKEKKQNFFWKSKVSDFSNSKQLMEKLSPLKFFFRNNTVPEKVESSLEFSVLSEQSVLKYRFQLYNQVVVQIRGSSEFNLFPPSELEEQELFPFLHENKRNIKNIEKLLSKKEKQVNIKLNKGDIIFIPALWIYQQKSVKASVYLNFRENSEEEVLFEKISFTDLPIESSFNTKQKIVVLKYSILRIISNLIEEQASFFEFCEEKPDLYFHKKIYGQRYSLLEADLVQRSDMAQQFEIHKCYNSSLNRHDGDFFKVLKDFDLKMEKRETDKLLNKISDLFLKIDNDLARFILLDDYLESLLMLSVKSPKDVIGFIKYCF
eukprot:TRINITY_DN3649_c0_g1_i1.p1 TRINITY_DN3649_c0_g1~~TRINITY_DN3649_c0_g1_i1.p1  ORF type:complete len:479 (+),score=115.34 TRINITY_DN3649_c0_g1_i1:129-1565(+)